MVGKQSVLAGLNSGEGVIMELSLACILLGLFILTRIFRLQYSEIL